MGLLHRTAQIAEEYLATLGDRRVGASLGFEDVLASLDAPAARAGRGRGGRARRARGARARA